MKTLLWCRIGVLAASGSMNFLLSLEPMYPPTMSSRKRSMGMLMSFLVRSNGFRDIWANSFTMM